MSYAGMAANVIGGELQGWASVLEKQAMYDQFKKEQALQAGYANQARGAFMPQIGASSPEAMTRGVQQGAQQRTAEYDRLNRIPSVTLGGGGQAYNPAVANAYGNMMGQARAQLGGYSDYALNQAINNVRAQQKLNQISNFAGGQARNVYPLQMYAAQHSMDDLSMIGQAISSIGGAAANYAAMNQGNPGAGGTQQYAMPIGPSIDANSAMAQQQYNAPIGPQPGGTGYSWLGGF